MASNRFGPPKTEGREYHDANGAAVIDFRPDDEVGDAEGNEIKAAIKLEDAAESLRLIYVALTRAVYRCYVIAGRSSLPLRMFISTLGHSDIVGQVEEHLRMFELDHLSREMTGSLSLGSKRRLELAMAFITNPTVLTLDEPFSGLSDLEIDEVIRVFRKYSHQKTIQIVEHKISKLTDIVDRLAVMHEGKIIASGLPKETLENPEVRRVYWKV